MYQKTFKRTKVSNTGYTTSSDEHFDVDLNEVDKLEFEEVVRPMGRDKAKNRGSSSNILGIERLDEIHNVASNFKNYNLNIESSFNFEKEKSAEKKKDREEKQRAQMRSK